MNIPLNKQELDRIIELLSPELDSDLLSRLKGFQQIYPEIPDEAGIVSGLADQVTQKYRDGF